MVQNRSDKIIFCCDTDWLFWERLHSLASQSTLWGVNKGKSYEINFIAGFTNNKRKGQDCGIGYFRLMLLPTFRSSLQVVSGIGIIRCAEVYFLSVWRLALGTGDWPASRSGLFSPGEYSPAPNR
jgi:hypothetical protein